MMLSSKTHHARNGRPHYRLGSALGMTPGTLLFAAFVDSLTIALHQPGPASAVLVIVTLILIVLGIWLGRKWLDRLD